MTDTLPATLTVETLPVIAHPGLRVITTSLLAQLYGTDTNNIRNNFARNTERFIAGQHFYRLEGEELRTFKHCLSSSDAVNISHQTRNLTLWTERGAARHAKMLDTDAAWEVFEKLENAYFRIPSDASPVIALPALITSAQAGELTTLVAERFPDGKHRPYAWSRFNRHFRLARYRELPAARFAEACAYIQALPLKAVAPLAVSGPIPLPIAHGWQRWLASNAGDRWVLREVPHDAFVMPMAQWPQVIRHEPVAQEDLRAVLSAIAERLSDKANSGGQG